jgi:hypothetical protein
MKNLFLTLFALMSINLFSQCENDITLPYFVNFEPEITISCDVDLSVVFPVALDECDDSVEIAWYQEITPGFCENNYDVFRVYRAFDNVGNQSVESQIIHVVDETSPLFAPFTNRIIECGDSIVFDDPQVTDNCSDFVLTYYNIIQNVDSCSTIYTRVWEAVDFCGNTSISSQTITSIDTTPPVITGPIYLEVNEGDNIDTLLVTVTDNCSSFNITYVDGQVSGNNIIRNYTATDACGNTSTFEQIIGVNIITPPGDDDEDEDEDDGDDDEDDDGDDDDEDDEDEEDEDEEDEDDNDGDDDDEGDDDEDEDSDKVAICHGTGDGSYHTIYVNQNAVQAHLNHGDYLGPCTEMVIDWQQILPNSDLRMKVIKGKDNKYKKFVRVN